MHPFQSAFRLGIAAASLALVAACSGTDAGQDESTTQSTPDAPAKSPEGADAEPAGEPAGEPSGEAESAVASEDLGDSVESGDDASEHVDGEEHAQEGEHHHAHTAKFGGTLVELGNHFANVELTHDPVTGEVALYTWDAHAESSQRSPTEAPVVTFAPHNDTEAFNITLAPRVSLTSGETVGDSSLFTGQHDSVKGDAHYTVTISEITLKGQTFTGVEFLHPADAHDHDHAHGEDEGEEHSHDH